MSPARSAVVDVAAMDELDLYACNTAELYPQHQAIIRNYMRKLARGTYDHTLAAKGWLNWVNVAAKRYCREFGGAPVLVFPMATRRALAARLEGEEHGAMLRGEYADCAPQAGAKVAS